MWVWREETARGGWRLDAYGTWTWDEPARLEPVGGERGDGRRTLGSRGHDDGWAREQDLREQRARDRRVREHTAREQRARAERLQPAMAAISDGFEATPIFRSVSRETVESAYPAIPAPQPGSGPFPAQVPGRRALAPVETVPPPAAGPFDDGLGPVASPEEELRRRAERRRRPHAEADGGRHVLRR